MFPSSTITSLPEKAKPDGKEQAGREEWGEEDATANLSGEHGFVNYACQRHRTHQPKGWCLGKTPRFRAFHGSAGESVPKAQEEDEGLSVLCC